MSALRRLALAFPLDWSHERGYSVAALHAAGRGPYYIAWDGGTGLFGEEWSASPRDADGVLLTGRNGAYHPIRIAQYALAKFGAWHAFGDGVAHEQFLIHARWLRDNQSRDGAYAFAFPWPKYGAAAGWRSAMAQGQAVSVLLRASDIAPGEGFDDAAQRAARPFEKAIEHGGVVWRDGHAVFLEEIANAHAPHVLNGCIFALWGLWEMRSRGAEERWVRPLIEQTVDTLRMWLPRFDCGWWSLYSLMRCANGHSHVATLKYHAFHVAQLRVLAAMFGDRVFTETADRWREYRDRRSSRTRVLAASAVSLCDRAFRYDTVAGGARA